MQEKERSNVETFPGAMWKVQKAGKPNTSVTMLTVCNRVREKMSRGGRCGCLALGPHLGFVVMILRVRQASIFLWNNRRTELRIDSYLGHSTLWNGLQRNFTVEEKR